MEAPIEIVAVDDNESDLDLIAAVLAADGHRVLRAANAREALELVRSGRAKVLLIDLFLPDLSGLDVLKAAQRVDPCATGIVLTASTRRKDAIDSMLDGAFDFLVKPVDSDLLRARVRRAIQHYLLQASLREKEREPIEACRDFLADVMHEMKNPLSIINGYASFLAKPEAQTGTMVASGLKAIRSSAEQLQSLVEDLLDTQRLRDRKVELRPEAVPVGQLASELADGFRVLAERRGVELCWGVVGDERVCVRADHKRIRQVLSNLLTNALKFTPQGGRVGLWARVEKDQVLFCVEDSGVGMRPDQCALAFERGRQFETPIPHRRGLGLGLAIARDFVEAHGGRIWAESEPGKGARFYFTLAVTQDKPDPARFVEPPITAVRYNS